MNNEDLNPCIKAIKHKIENMAIGWDLQDCATLAPVTIEFLSNATTTTRHAAIALFFLSNADSVPHTPNDPRDSQALSRASLIFLRVISNSLLLYHTG